jgi:hypothetical protein
MRKPKSNIRVSKNKISPVMTINLLYPKQSRFPDPDDDDTGGPTQPPK